jgi:methyl-accepting chemotaxis protein
MSSFTRRRYIVDWKLQGSLCAHGLMSGGLVLAALVGGIFVPLLWNLGSDPTAHIEEQSIVMLYMHERLWFLVLACALIVLVSAIKLSHRIAGPLVRYKRNLRLVAEGKLPSPLRTRPGDYLAEEVECLNAAVAGIAERSATIRSASDALRTEIAAARHRPGAMQPAQAETLQRLAEALDVAVQAIGKHDTGDDRPPVTVAAPAVALAAAGDAGR